MPSRGSKRTSSGYQRHHWYHHYDFCWTSSGGWLVWQLLLVLVPVLVVQAQSDEEPTNKGDSYSWLETAAFSPGIMMIFNNYVASISATVGDYRQLATTLDTDTAVTVWNETPASRAQARRIIRKGVFQAIAAYILLLAATTPIVTVLARPLDQRMLYIIHGLSRVTATVCVSVLSIRVAQWLGLYREDPYRLTFMQQFKTTERLRRMGTTPIELQHAVRWSVMKKLMRPYFVLLFLMQQGADADNSGRIAVPISIMTGFATGAAIDYGMYKVRRWEDARVRWWLSLALVGFLCFVAVGTLFTGAYFIAYVWDDSKATTEDLDDSYWPYWALGVGAVVLPSAHVCVWLWNNNFFCVSPSSFSRHGSSSLHNDASSKPYKPRMAMSMLLSGRIHEDDLVEINDDDEQPKTAMTTTSSSSSSSDGNGTMHNVKPASHTHMPTMEEISEEEDGMGKSNDVERKDTNVDPESQSQTPPDAASEEALPNETDGEMDKEESLPEADVPPKSTAEGISTENTAMPTDTTINATTTPPTTKELLMRWKCCGCVRGKNKPIMQKLCSCGVWTLYIWVCSLCLYAVIVNIGASQQQEAARAKLPFVFEELYRYMDEGPVCAFDNRDAESNITTFENREAAHDAGFLVLHCGACAACSDWHNLELEYTTRDFLALESRNCALKSLWGGGRDVLVECLEGDDIGFQGQCAVCWADDILCTKDFCTFIAMQSFMINTLANFEVGPDTITSAACEEAHCEAGNPGHFVSCSGATRRRMNVTSSIKRPGSQQCSIVDVDWQELFPEPHPNA